MNLEFSSDIHFADVKGFIEHNGKDFLYQGYWKVYENVEERKKMFSIYNVVKEEFIREMQAGKDLWHAARSVRQHLTYSLHKGIKPGR